jgi:Zn-finger nucleic acid-binding protein
MNEPAPTEPEPQDAGSLSLRPETQGPVTFYHCPPTPGYWFGAGELDTMLSTRIVLDLPEPEGDLTLEVEFERGPECCPKCATSNKLIEMRCHVASQARMRACNVCHGRWIGRESLELILHYLRYRGFLGVLKRLLGLGRPRRANRRTR